MINVNELMRRGFLVSPSLVKEKNIDEKVFDKLEKLKDKPLVINNNIYNTLKNSNEFSIDISWKEFDKSRVFYEKNKNSKDYEVFLEILNYNSNEESKIKVNRILKQVSIPQDSKIEEDVIESNLIVVK